MIDEQIVMNVDCELVLNGIMTLMKEEPACSSLPTRLAQSCTPSGAFIRVGNTPNLRKLKRFREALVQRLALPLILQGHSRTHLSPPARTSDVVVEQVLAIGDAPPEG